MATDQLRQLLSAKPCWWSVSTKISGQIRRWRLHRWIGLSLAERNSQDLWIGGRHRQ
jgi:hypothetical protein